MGNIRQIDGSPVVDAVARLSIKVTGHDVSHGSAKDPAHCAVARACVRQYDIAECRVHLSRVYLRHHDGTWARYVTPQYLRAEIVAFDRGGRMVSGEYELLPVPVTQRAGGASYGGSRKTKTGKGKKRSHPIHLIGVRSSPTSEKK